MNTATFGSSVVLSFRTTRGRVRSCFHFLVSCTSTRIDHVRFSLRPSDVYQLNRQSLSLRFFIFSSFPSRNFHHTTEGLLYVVQSWLSPLTGWLILFEFEMSPGDNVGREMRFAGDILNAHDDRFQSGSDINCLPYEKCKQDEFI